MSKKKKKNKQDKKQKTVLVEMLNETTASGYVYEVPAGLKTALDGMGYEELGLAMPEQAPAAKTEREDIAAALSRLAHEKGVDGKGCAARTVEIPCYTFEGGWKTDGKRDVPAWPAAFDPGRAFELASTEYELSLQLTAALPKGTCAWGFGFDPRGRFVVSTVDKAWDDEADQDDDMFRAYVLGDDGMFHVVAFGVGEKSLQDDGIDWAPKLSRVEGMLDRNRK